MSGGSAGACGDRRRRLRRRAGSGISAGTTARRGRATGAAVPTPVVTVSPVRGNDQRRQPAAAFGTGVPPVRPRESARPFRRRADPVKIRRTAGPPFEPPGGPTPLPGRRARSSSHDPPPDRGPFGRQPPRRPPVRGPVRPHGRDHGGQQRDRGRRRPRVRRRRGRPVPHLPVVGGPAANRLRRDGRRRPVRRGPGRPGAAGRAARRRGRSGRRAGRVGQQRRRRPAHRGRPFPRVRGEAGRSAGGRRDGDGAALQAGRAGDGPRPAAA